MSKYKCGEKANGFNSSHVACSFCQKDIVVPKYKTKAQNKNGESHLFCSKECYYAFRKQYYVGDKLYNTGRKKKCTGIAAQRAGRKMSPSFCEKVRKATLQQYADGTLNRQSKPQQIVNTILNSLTIPYVNERTVGYYAFDNYLIKENLYIEVMGDYFHANPNIYSFDMCNTMQLKDIERDQRKHTYIVKYENIEPLYLWETDILCRRDLCEALILLYIQQNGHLDDYQSFNYQFDNEQLVYQFIQNPYFLKIRNDSEVA